MTAQTIRVGLSYDSGGGEVTSCVFINAPQPHSDFVPQADSGGNWISVSDSTGAAVFHLPLPDPDAGDEVIDDDGQLGRVQSEPKRRTISVELPWPGEGSTVAVHARSEASQATRRTRGTRGLRGAGDDSEVARSALEPVAVSRTRAALPVFTYPQWGHTNSAALTLVFLPDGFTAAEMPAFQTAVKKVLDAMALTQPFKDFLPALKAVRIDTPSNDSGIGAAARDTAFRGKFTIPRVIEADQTRAQQVINQNFTSSAVAMICANTTDYGGSGGAAMVFSCEPTWSTEIAIHELGHSLFLLADEYTAGGQAATLEPVEANVSRDADRARLKWAALVAPETPLPTSQADIPAGVRPSDFVGAFVGAKYQDSGIHRPAFDCKMRTPGVPFCPVCSGAIETRLSRHLPN